MEISIIIEICFIIYVVYYYQNIKNNIILSRKSKFLLGFAIFCSFGSFVLLIDDFDGTFVGSIIYAILASILYLCFILSCNNNLSSTHLEEYLEEITEKDIQIKILKQKIEELKKDNNIEKNKINNIAKLNAEIETLKTEKHSLSRELENLTKDLIIEYGNISDYSNISSQEIKNELNILKLEQNTLIKDNKAIIITIKKDILNKKIINDNIAQLLRSFNTECSLIIDNLTIKNIDTSRNKIEKSFIALNKLYQIDDVQISQKFYELKLKELTLNYSYLQQLEDEKEQQKAIKEQLLEEEKVRKEIEREKIRIEKEEKQFKNEISKLMSYLNKTSSEIEKQLYIDKIKELESKLNLLEKDKENVLQREQNTRAGFVYIISNIGSFGENIYKIGMTRRLDPMDRIKELGDASVPFKFDVHALIFSDDAPALENILHQTFKEFQVNKCNVKKEFYNIDLDRIKEVVKNNYNNTVDFKDYAEAEEYRRSLEMKNSLLN